MSAPTIEATTVEFVVFDAQGNAVDSVDPYLGHTEIGPGIFRVANVFGEYITQVPRGGSYMIRARS